MEIIKISLSFDTRRTKYTKLLNEEGRRGLARGRQRGYEKGEGEGGERGAGW